MQLEPLDLPDEWMHEIMRRQYVSQQQTLARMSFEAPDERHAFVFESMRLLPPEGSDIDSHFTPLPAVAQRIAVVRTAICSRRCARGRPWSHRHHRDVHRAWNKVSSGEEIPADIVVTATGFNLSASATSR